jgi:hypothetical protein
MAAQIKPTDIECDHVDWINKFQFGVLMNTVMDFRFLLSYTTALRLSGRVVFYL